MSWESDDSGYSWALADAMARQQSNSDAFEGNWWATQEVEITSHEGSDRFRRNFTRITHISKMMESAGLLNEQQAEIMRTIGGATALIYGSVLALQGLRSAYQVLHAVWSARAAARTAQLIAAGPPGWALIAVAGVTASVVVADLAYRSNIHVSVDYTTALGRSRITNTVRNNTPAVG